MFLTLLDAQNESVTAAGWMGCGRKYVLGVSFSGGNLELKESVVGVCIVYK